MNAPLPATRRPARRRPGHGSPSRRSLPRRLARGLGLTVVGTLDAALVTTLATGLAARSVHPDVWWVPQAAALGLPMAVAASLPVAGWWLARLATAPRRPAWRWASTAVHVALAAMGVARLLPAGGPATASDAPRLRVMTLNAGGNPPHSAAGQGRMAQLVGTEAPDVAAFQEVGATWVPTEGDSTVLALSPVLTPLQRDSLYAVSPPASDLEQVVAHAPVFARQAPDDVTEHSLGSPLDEDAGTYGRALVTWQGRRVAVFNVHLRSFGAERPWRAGQPRDLAAWARALHSFAASILERAAEAERFRAALDAERLPFIVTGDLNSTPHQWAYAHVARGLRDALARHGELFGRSTYPSSVPLVRIDAVLASPAWSVDDAWVGPDGLSDHRPVFADLRLRGADGG